MATATTARPARRRVVRGRILLYGVVLPAVVGAIATLLRCMVIEPHLLGYPAWVFSRDLFIPLPAAKYVAHGAVFQMYEPSAGYQSIGYPYTPALPILLAPVGWIGDRFALLDNLTYPVARPSLFPIFGPVAVILGIVPLMWSVGNVLRDQLSTARVVAVQWAVCAATAALTLIYIHPEDAIACAGLIGGANAAANGRWRRAGAMLAIATLFKQWAVIPAVVVLAGVEPGKRLVAGFYAYAIPVIVMIPFVLATPHATIDALTGSQASISIGQRQVWTSWVFSSPVYVNATPLRLLWLGVALIVASYVRSRPTVVVLLGGLGVVMLSRLLFEPTIFAYYLGPAFGIAIVCAALLRQPIALRAACAVALQYWCASHEFPQVVWWIVLGLGGAYVCAPLFDALRAGERDDPMAVGSLAVPSVV